MDQQPGAAAQQPLEIIMVDDRQELPEWLDEEGLVHFLHEYLKPFEDTVPDIRRGVSYAFGDGEGQDGFVVLGAMDERLVGALVMLRTNMQGYIPENLLLFVAVNSQMRGRGLGRQIIEAALERAEGDVKLHVEYDNPAKRLYERIGFTSKYAEMRYSK
jgi:[ribosomal protein S18]-alanine N-acetyltransferase